MNREQKINRVLAGLSHTGYTTEIEKCEARLLIEELTKENEKLNHYKLLYQKVKERNDLGLNKIQELKENAKSEITTLTTGDKAYYKYVNNIFKELEEILKGNNEE